MTPQLALLIKTMRDRAERATPGPWELFHALNVTSATRRGICTTGGYSDDNVDTPVTNKSNAQHIAFFDPATCKLIADILEQQAMALAFYGEKMNWELWYGEGVIGDTFATTVKELEATAALAQSEQLAAKIVGVK